MEDLNTHKTGSGAGVSPSLTSEEQLRAHRRRLLKTGAAMAPLAITLSAGNAWATGVNPGLVSDGRCFANLYENIDQLGLRVKENRNEWVDFDRTKASHWFYLKEHASYQDGLSCLTSISTSALTQKLTEIGDIDWTP
ncbi:hypothetical protein [Luteithermobacter gelatinilyticus]|uniref:hypothetical protein n=1 Tax=Luteithermobacter gelatinilyticus TaxID=2582913 RepID=UPI001107049D|nr:hypothetical protein [Luteithermobacter gelatinilyticus]